MPFRRHGRPVIPQFQLDPDQSYRPDGLRYREPFDRGGQKWRRYVPWDQQVVAAINEEIKRGMPVARADILRSLRAAQGAAAMKSSGSMASRITQGYMEAHSPEVQDFITSGEKGSSPRRTPASTTRGRGAPTRGNPLLNQNRAEAQGFFSKIFAPPLQQRFDAPSSMRVNALHGGTAGQTTTNLKALITEGNYNKGFAGMKGAARMRGAKNFLMNPADRFRGAAIVWAASEAARGYMKYNGYDQVDFTDTEEQAQKKLAEWRDARPPLGNFAIGQARGFMADIGHLFTTIGFAAVDSFLDEGDPASLWMAQKLDMLKSQANWLRGGGVGPEPANEGEREAFTRKYIRHAIETADADNMVKQKLNLDAALQRLGDSLYARGAGNAEQIAKRVRGNPAWDDFVARVGAPKITKAAKEAQEEAVRKLRYE